MSLVRKAIRRELAKQLVGKTIAGENVFTGRKDRLQRDELPAICVYSTGESIEYRSDPGPMIRSMRLGFELHARPLTPEEERRGLTTDDQVDELETQVVKILHDNQLLPGLRAAGVNIELADQSRLLDVEVERDALGLELYGAARIVWGVSYEYKAYGEDPTMANALRSVGVGFDFGGETVDTEIDLT